MTQASIWVRPDPVADKRLELILNLLGLDEELPCEQMEEKLAVLCERLGIENLDSYLSSLNSH